MSKAPTRLHSACMLLAVEVEFALAQLSKPRDDHAPIYALHCLSICFNKNLFPINLLKKYMLVFLNYILVDNLSFKVVASRGAPVIICF
jgi:hypothetical protein